MHTAALVAEPEGHVRLLVLRPLIAQLAELRSILVVFVFVVVDEKPNSECAGGGTGGDDLPGRRHELYAELRRMRSMAKEAFCCARA